MLHGTILSTRKEVKRGSKKALCGRLTSCMLQETTLSRIRDLALLVFENCAENRLKTLFKVLA